MSAENTRPRLADEAALRAHAQVIGSTGSGKGSSLLAALGLEHGDAYGRAYFMSASAETLASFLAKFRDIRSFADFARYAEEPGSYAATDDTRPNH